MGKEFSVTTPMGPAPTEGLAQEQQTGTIRSASQTHQPPSLPFLPLPPLPVPTCWSRLLLLAACPFWKKRSPTNPPYPPPRFPFSFLDSLRTAGEMLMA
ncbi:hypothetical protein DPEC_G00255780 [Dallia pectoralis]|uniref:Uncharacterized protein n=1 Tax=Dallia pectoralis TaxID=75939 RepID=A0ACC2FUS1_DALPE|nr:hypothetical protein DPEC_G00255780 [Dallia pectoralis]